MTPYRLVQPYKKYFQKSKAFLYPALGFKRGAPVSPAHTYISYGDRIRPEDRKLLVFYRDLTSPFYSFANNHLHKHPKLATSFKIDSGGIVYIFDFEMLKEDWDWFLQGKYSRLSDSLKQRICQYFGGTSNEYSYIDSYLYPEKYYDLYASLLNVDAELLRAGGELTTVYDAAKEDLLLALTKAAPKV